jgi:hypothetical protein
MRDPLPRPPPPARRRRRGWWTLLGVVVIALAVVVAGFFFGRRQIGEMFARKLGERFAEDGVFLGWKSSDWVPGGGIRLRGLALYRDAAKRERLALFGMVTATRGDPSWLHWDKVDFAAADTQLLVGSGAAETRLEHMDMLLLIQPGKIDLREFQASLQGLRVELKGAFADAPPAVAATPDAASKPAAQSGGLFRDVNLDWLKPVKEWVKFQPEKHEPVLRMELHSPLDDSGRSFTMTFDGSKFRWRGQKWDFMQAAAKIPIGRENVPIDIDYFRIGHGGRKAEIAAAFDPAGRVIRISKFDSRIELLALARALVPDAFGNLSAASTSGAWQISGTGEIPVDHPENFRWNGDAALDGDLVYASGETNISLLKPTFSVRVEEQVVTVSDLKAGLWEGSLNAPKMQVHLPSKEKKLRIETQLTLDGVRSQSIVNSLGAARKQPVPLDWKGAWRISGAAEIPVDQPEHFTWNGDMELDGDLVYASGQTNVSLLKPTFSVRVEEKVLSISDFKAGLWEGALDVSRLQVHLPSKEKKLRVETQLTLEGARWQSILNSFGEARKQPVPLDWKGAWRISGAAEIPVNQPEHFTWNGDVALDGDLVYASGETNVALLKPVFSVRVEEQVVTVSDLKAGVWEGRLDVSRLQVRLPSKEKKLQFETQLSLGGVRSQSILDSLGGARKQPGVVPWNWKGAWRINGTGEVPLDEPDNFRWNGDVALEGDFTYASGQTAIALLKPTFSVRAEKQVVTISDFKAGLWEGRLTAPKMKIHLPAKDKKVRFETQLTLDGARPPSVRRSFSAGQKQPRVVRLNWKDAWRISATGEIPVDHPENFRWNGDVTLGGDLAYASGETNVALQKPVFSVRVEKEMVAISDFKAGLWEGSLNAPSTLVFLPSAKKKPGFETQITLTNARLESIINSFGGAQTDPGVVQCDWKGGGEFDLASLAGSGALSIGEAQFCRMPVLGPLHLVFENLTPKFSKDVPSTMTVNHRMAGSILFLEDLKLVSEQVSLDASGNIDLAREYARFTAKGRLRKIPGLATVLLTSLLEFKGEGPVDDMRWSLKSVPGVSTIGKGAKQTTKTATDAVKGAGRAVKGLIGLPGKLLRDE